MSKAFAVDLGIYETAEEKYRGREGAVHLPDDLADIVEGVFGLDNRKMAKPLHRIGRKDTIDGPRDATPAQTTVPLTPPQVAQLYGFPTSPNAAGQTIGIFEFGGGYKPSDVQLFYNSVSAAGSLHHLRSASTASPTTRQRRLHRETLLDIDVAGSAAPGAKLAVYSLPGPSRAGWMWSRRPSTTPPTSLPSFRSAMVGPRTGNHRRSDLVAGGHQGGERHVPGSRRDGRDRLACRPAITAPIAAWATQGARALSRFGSLCHSCGGTRISNVSGLKFTENTWNDNENVATGGGISDIFYPPNFPLPIWQNWANIPGSVNDGHKARGDPRYRRQRRSRQRIHSVPKWRQHRRRGRNQRGRALVRRPGGPDERRLGRAGRVSQSQFVRRALCVCLSRHRRRRQQRHGRRSGVQLRRRLGRLHGPGQRRTARRSRMRCAAWGCPLPSPRTTASSYMVWKGMERDDRVFYSSFNGNRGPAATGSGHRFEHGRSAGGLWRQAVHGVEGYPDRPGHLLHAFRRHHLGTAATGGRHRVERGPRLAVLGNNLFMAWKGVENDQRIFFNQFNGSSWTAQQFVPNVATSVGPAVVELQRRDLHGVERHERRSGTVLVEVQRRRASRRSR